VFRELFKKFFPNSLDALIQKGMARRVKTVLIHWDMRLSSIPLLAFAVIHRIHEHLPGCKITFLTRSDLREGFRLLQGADVIFEPGSLSYDLVIETQIQPDFCSWQWGYLTPRLTWREEMERPIDLAKGFTYIGVEPSEKQFFDWDSFFSRIEKFGYVRVILFGSNQTVYTHKNIIDFRGTRSLYEQLSIIKNFCSAVLLPDSDLLSMIYYLDLSFPIQVISLFTGNEQGVLKQRVSSPNPKLSHKCLAQSATVDEVFDLLFPKKNSSPLSFCHKQSDVIAVKPKRVAAIILAGGQGSRLGFEGPKGLYEVGGKSLFKHVMEKIPSGVPALVMTSPLNHEETISYFAVNGLNARFFQQKMVDLLDENYEPLGFGPDGNGGVYKQLVLSGLLDELESEEINTVLISPIENPLADPVDPKLIQALRDADDDVMIKCVDRIKGESMGALSGDGIVEYFAITDDCYHYSYTGQVAMTTQFVRKAAAIELPYHWVLKKGLWKREKLLFDAFGLTKKIGALCYPRHECYGPIKGPESKEITEKLLAEFV
jgi:hypothetical protein